jgi:glutamyl-tRNA synthetase/glutamyl-Q tRNA(Asp) synthetase
VSWRLRLPEGEHTFLDLLVGPQSQTQPPGGDVVIRDRLGNWTYQFAVSVDDLQQGIDLVIRGCDLVGATGRQIAIGRLLGRERPARFAHHPLVMVSPAQKLSKSDGATGIRALRAAGWTPAQVIGEAAGRIGLVPAGAVLPVDAIGQLLA